MAPIKPGFEHFPKLPPGKHHLSFTSHSITSNLTQSSASKYGSTAALHESSKASHIETSDLSKTQSSLVSSMKPAKKHSNNTKQSNSTIRPSTSTSTLTLSSSLTQPLRPLSMMLYGLDCHCTELDT